MHLRAPHLLALIVASVSAAALAQGCAEADRECFHGDWRACECADGSPGYQQCASDGSEYGECDCSGFIPGITTSASTGGGDGGGGGGGKLGFMEECMTNEQCET